MKHQPLYGPEVKLYMRKIESFTASLGNYMVRGNNITL